MKKAYESPSVEVIDFEAEDIVTDEQAGFSNVDEGVGDDSGFPL